MKSRHSDKSQTTEKKINSFLAILLASILLLSLSACAGVSGSKTVTVQRDPPPKAMETANEAASLMLQQYIYARLKTEFFITADFTSMKPDEIKAMVSELTALWQTSVTLASGTEKIADQALLVLDAQNGSQTASQTASDGVNGYYAKLLAAESSAYKAEQLDSQTVPDNSKDAQKWAEDLTAKYDAIKGGHTIKQLAQQLGTDAKSAYAQLAAAQEIISAGANADAAFYDKLTKVAMATKTACKVGLFVTATVVTGGGSLTALAGSSMTLAEGGAAIIGGVDCITDVAATGSTIVLGDNHQVTVSANNVKDKLAPVSAVVGLVTFTDVSAGEKIAYIGDTLTDWIYEGKILGVKVTDDSGGTAIVAKQTDTSKVAANNAVSTIEGLGFIPPENQTAAGTAIIDTYKTGNDDAITAIDSLKTQEKDTAKEAGVYKTPTLDELVGSYPDGTLTISDVYVSDALKASEAEKNSSVSESSSEAGGTDGAGCDLAMLPAIEAMKGQAKPMTLTIAKTGDNAGTFMLLAQGDSSEGGISMKDTPPMNFTYSDGVLTISYSSEGGLVNGTLTADFGDNNAVTLNGTLRTSTATYGDDFYIDMLVSGSKLPVT